jgi:ATP-dependent protease HslVU (ClpYQ) ATPase subunit
MSVRLAEHKKDDRPERFGVVREALGPKSIVLIGLMGAGKTAVGRRLASKLDFLFIDADTEIEVAAGRSISEIFAEHARLFPPGRAGDRAAAHAGPQVLPQAAGPI